MFLMFGENEMRTMKDYHDFYLKFDVPLLAVLKLQELWIMFK